MIDYAAVLKRLHADREWTLDGDSYEGLTMLDGRPAPTKESLDAAWPQVAQEIATEKQAKQAALASAHQKLAQLGLTSQEIKALVG